MVSRRKRASASSLSAVTSAPATRMRPVEGRSSPAMRPSRVDFPLPDGPAMATNWRAGMSSVTSASTLMERSPLAKRMPTPVIAIMVASHTPREVRRRRGGGHAGHARSLGILPRELSPLDHARPRQHVHSRAERRAGAARGSDVGARHGSGGLGHTLAAALGLSAILAASSWAFAAVKVAGAAYLIYLGIAALRRPRTPLVAPTLHPASPWRVYRQGVISNLLNPKVAVFFLAFLPQFVDPGSGWGPLPFLLLGGLFVTGGTLWCALFALGAR